MSSFLLTPSLAQTAVHMIAGPVSKEFIHDVPGRVAAHIVVLDPTVTRYDAPEPKILFQWSLGEPDRSKWPYPYQEFALKKATLAWRHNMSSHLILRNQPHLLAEGDFKYGGAIVHEGIVVSVSGLKSWWQDFIVSGMVATALHGLVIGAVEAELGRKPFHIGEADPVPPPTQA